MSKIKVRVAFHLANVVLMDTHDTIARTKEFEMDEPDVNAPYSRVNPIELMVRTRLAVDFKDVKDEHGCPVWIEVDQIAIQNVTAEGDSPWYYVTPMNLRDLILAYQHAYIEATVTPNDW